MASAAGGQDRGDDTRQRGDERDDDQRTPRGTLNETPSSENAPATIAASREAEPIPVIPPISAMIDALVADHPAQLAALEARPRASIPSSRVRSKTARARAFSIPKRLTTTDEPEQDVEQVQQRG